jgi:hypothetical protein
MEQPADGLLRRAGWHPERAEDVSAVRSLLESRGYVVSEKIILFLREFDGISINFAHNKRMDEIRFDARYAISQADPEWISYYEGRTKTSLVPIGYSNYGHMMLMQSDEGRFYGSFDEFLCALGSDSKEMIINLINQDREPLV